MSRDLVLVLESTGDLGWFVACVKDRVIYIFFCVLTELTPNERCKFFWFQTDETFLKVCEKVYI